jgi:hypothetical protein
MMPESMMQLPLVATFFLAACAANVRPSSDADVATDSQINDSSGVADSALADATGSDASTDDASEDVVVPPNARVIVTNTVCAGESLGLDRGHATAPRESHPSERLVDAV